jgi:hypothetical protein
MLMKPDPETWRCDRLPSGTGYRLPLLLIVLLAVVPAVQPSASPQEDEEFDMYVSHGDPIANSLPSLPIHISGWMRNKSSFPRWMSIYLEWLTPSGSIYNVAQNGCT